MSGRMVVRGVLVLGVAAVVLSWLGAPPLWDPVETSVTMTPPTTGSWLEVVVQQIDLGATAFGARLAHAILALVALVVVWLASSRDRAAMFGVIALVASPMFLLGARSAVGGMVIVAPIALASWGLVAALRSPMRRELVLLAIGSAAATLALGVVAPIVLLVAGLASSSSRRRLLILGVVIVAAAGGALAVLAIAGGRIWPGALPKAHAFEQAFDALALGAFPLALAIPIGLAAVPLDEERATWLGLGIAWSVVSAIWFPDPALLFAPLAPLAMFAGSTLEALVELDTPAKDDTNDRRPLALAIVIGAISLLVARGFSLEAGRMTSAHLGGTIPHEAPLGWLLWGCFAVAGGGLAFAVTASKRRQLAIWVALAASVAVGVEAERRVAKVSRESSVEPLLALAARHHMPVEAHLGVGELVAYLRSAGCRGALVASAELVPLHRTGVSYHVIGDEAGGHRLVTSCLPPGEKERDTLRDVLLAKMPEPWHGKRVDVEWGKALRLVAWEAPAQAKISEKIDVTFVFEVVGPLVDDHYVQVRLSGCNLGFGPHELGRELTPSALRPGDLVLDKAKIEFFDPVEPDQPCDHQLSVGWGSRNDPMPVSRGTGDETNRVTLTTIRVLGR